MQIELTGKSAIVTGSTAGIGLAIAKGLAGSGARVVVNGRSQTSVDRAVAEVKDATGNADVLGFAGDLGQSEACDALVRAHAACDILINNLGIFAQQDVFEIPDSDWIRFFEVNVMSGVRLSRAYLPGMMQRQWGRIVFISSESALNIPAEMIHYGMTKTAQLAIARGLAKRAAGSGVTLNAVLPGPTLSRGVAQMLEEQVEQSGQSLEQAAAEFVTAMRPSSILRRAASVEEVANLVVYIASPLASATTGAALRVDGGVVDSIV